MPDQPHRTVTPSDHSAADAGATASAADPATTAGPPSDPGESAPPAAPPGYELLE